MCHNDLRDRVADLSVNPLRPRTCATTPSYTQVARCKVQRLSWQGPNPPHKYRINNPRNVRANFRSVTSVRKVLTVFTTYMLWTLTQNTICRRHQRGVFKMQKRQRKRCIWRLSSSNVDTFHRPMSLLMGYYVWRWRLLWKVYPSALQQSGSNPTTGRVDTSILVFILLFCGPHAGSSGGTKCPHTGSVCNTCSGRTARD